MNKLPPGVGPDKYRDRRLTAIGNQNADIMGIIDEGAEAIIPAAILRY